MAFSSNFFDPFGDLKSNKKKPFSDDPLDFGNGFGSSTRKDEKRGSSDEEGSRRRRSSGSSSTGRGSRRGSGEEEDPPPDELEEDWPSAPPIDILDSIKGYEMVSFDATMVPPPLELQQSWMAPPSHPPPPPGAGALGEGIDSPDADPALVLAVAAEKSPEVGGGEEEETKPAAPLIVMPANDCKISEDQARSALLSHIADHCCYGKSAAKNMTIKTMECQPAFHYELQTFSEKRETAWTYAAIRPGYTDMMGGGSIGCVPPLPWEIMEEPTQVFKDEVRLVQVPNTGSTKSCHRCRGTGGMTCRDCNGKGWSRCLNCHGDGWLHDSGGHRERCFYCQHSKHGHGQLDCAKCSTKGKVNCATCEGHGQIRCFIQLSITWKVHTAEHIVEHLDLPQELIRDVSGQVAFEEESPRVKPVEAFGDAEKGIKEASTRLVFDHLNSFSDQKVLRQRHQVRIVPVNRVSYEWKNKMHQYYVYGYENRIHMPKYPQKCCWGCQIL